MAVDRRRAYTQGGIQLINMVNGRSHTGGADRLNIDRAKKASEYHLPT